MAVRNWNPSEPYALGLEWPGMRTIALPLSQDAEYGHTFQSSATEDINEAWFEIVAPEVDLLAINAALVTVYERDSNDVDETGNELEYGTVTSTLCLASAGTLGGAAALAGGAASAQAALASPNDFQYISFSSGAATADISFDTAGLFTGKRILELKLRYVARGPVMQAGATSDPTVEIVVRSGGANGLTMYPPVDEFDDMGVQHASLGEMFFDTTVDPKCWPWTVANVQAFAAAGSIVLRISKGFDVDAMQLHYLALEVVWCEENRVAVGGLQLGYTSSRQEAMTVGPHRTDLRAPDGTDNWSKTADHWYTVTVCTPRPPTHAELSYGVSGNVPYIPLVDAFEIFENHQGRVSPRLASNVLGALGADSRLCPIKFVTTGGLIPTDFDPYDKVEAAQVYAGGNTQTQRIAQHSGGGSVNYPWIRFYARIIGDPTDVPAIDITTADGTMAYYANDLLLLPEIFDGWRQVTLQWPTVADEPVISNAGTDYDVAFSTTQGNVANRWEILAESAYGLMVGTNGNPTYGGPTATTRWQEGATAHTFGDLVVTLHTAPPAISGWALAAASIALSVDTYDVNVAEPCRPTAFAYAALSWTASSLPTAEFAYYEIQRQDVIDPTWRTIAKLTTKAAASFSDVEARHGVQTEYRMRLCRADGICGAWTTTKVVTLAVTSAPCGTLYFSTNTDDGNLFAYTEVFDGSPVEEFGFVEAGSVVSQRMYGRYGTQSFHPTERGGVRFERDVVVNAIAVPSEGTADRAFRALRNLAWADVPYVCVKDDLGNRWFSTIIVPNGTMQRAANLYIANVQVIEATDVPYPVATQT